MFSQVSVCPQGWVSLVPSPFCGEGMPGPRSVREGLSMSGGGYLQETPQILTPSSIHNTYGQQVGDTHLTGILLHAVFYYFL